MMNNYNSRKPVFFILLFLTVVIFQHCANVIAPVGGPRDITPPKVIQSNPPNQSTNFTGNKFSLRFDEFVKLEKINQQLLISPPMVNFPTVKLKGKELHLMFNDALKPNTTYSVFFGDAIQDITEGNALHNYSYVFSTGNTIDSLSLRGKVVDAFDLKPVGDVTVMLYKNNNDSLPLDSLPLYVKPYYISKTNKNGDFRFSGLADTSYLLFALLDQNYSMTFDQPSEKIAFIDSMVIPQFRAIPHIDSSLFDTITNLPHDSLQLLIDSLWNRADSLADNTLRLHTLYLFSQPDTVQKLLKAELLRKNTLRFIFRNPVDSLHITSLNFNPDNVWYLPEWGKEKDTLMWFLRKNHPDTLKLIVADGSNILDTLDIRAIPKEKFSKRKKKSNEAKKAYLNWHPNLQGNIKPGQTLQITFDYPIRSIYWDSTFLINGKDTVRQPAFRFIDSLHRKIQIPFTVKPNTSYQLLIPDSAVIDWNGLHNKSIRLNLKSKAEKEYGSITFNLQPSHLQHYIFQILKDKDEIIKQVFFSKPQKLKIGNLDPNTYKFKIIFDSNNNKKWDSGNYFRKQEPEKVIYYNKTIKVRPNWEVSEVWKF